MINLFMDLLFPQRECCICRHPGIYSTKRPWCSSCQDRLVELQCALPICDRCGKYLLESEGPFCNDCETRTPPFEISRAVGPYEEPYRISTKVLKFLGRRQLAYRMGKMMAAVVKKEPRFWPIDMIVPVPSTRASIKQRGFNQTEALGCQISKELKIKMYPHLLVRVKETPSQRECSREEREKNLLQAFDIRNVDCIKGKNILLVDDVFTTGSTSRECARTLLDHGAKKVNVITWATGKGY
jgi:competence protein ComFC